MMWPEWLESFLGVDYLHGVTWVSTGNGNGLTDAELLRVGDLPQLDFLVISGSRTTDRGLANLGKLKKLKTLTLDAPGITDAGLAHLNGLTSLKTLGFSPRTPITAAGLAHLKGLNSLEELNLVERRNLGCRIGAPGWNDRSDLPGSLEQRRQRR